MTGFKSKRQAAQVRVVVDDAQGYIADYEAALKIAYEIGFENGKKAQRKPFSAVSIHATQTAWKMGYEAAKAEMQPEQEPCVGKDPRCPCQDGDACHYKDCVDTKARPVAQRTWVGLTDAEFLEACELAERGNYLVAFQRIQAKLKERNNGY
jgi:hypothetical protein